MDEATARWEIEQSSRVLRDFAPVTSFRAPYLRFPDAYVPLLEQSGFASIPRWRSTSAPIALRVVRRRSRASRRR
jgi:hypothetical protein